MSGSSSGYPGLSIPQQRMAATALSDIRAQFAHRDTKRRVFAYELSQAVLADEEVLEVLKREFTTNNYGASVVDVNGKMRFVIRFF